MLLTDSPQHPSIYQPYKFCLTTNNQAVKNTCADIAARLEFKRQNKTNKEAYLESLLLNLKNCEVSDQYIGVSKNKNSYLIPTRYRPDFLTYRVVDDVVKQLCEKKYVDLVKGSYDKKRKTGKPTRLYPTDKLQPLLAGIESESINVNRPLEFVELRNSDKVPIDYTDTPGTISMRRDLMDYAALCESVKLSLKNVPTDLLQMYALKILPMISVDIKSIEPIGGVYKELPLQQRYSKRIFNVNFSLGGRFYGNVESIPKDLRPYLSIDNEATVELDFSGMHIRLLYHLTGIDYRQDPYLFGSDSQLRKLFKFVGLTAINASRTDAIKALKSIVNDPCNDFRRLLSKNKPILSLVDQFTEKHKPIAGQLFKETGLILQHIDSDIANSILKYFTSKNILCLSIHDSFIIPAQYANELHQVMTDSYKRKVGYTPIIK